MPIRVLVADDQALVRAGFAELIEATDGLEVVGGPPTALRPWTRRDACSRTWC